MKFFHTESAMTEMILENVVYVDIWRNLLCLCQRKVVKTANVQGDNVEYKIFGSLQFSVISKTVEIASGA